MSCESLMRLAYPQGIPHRWTATLSPMLHEIHLMSVLPSEAEMTCGTDFVAA